MSPPRPGHRGRAGPDRAASPHGIACCFGAQPVQGHDAGNLLKPPCHAELIDRTRQHVPDIGDGIEESKAVRKLGSDSVSSDTSDEPAPGACRSTNALNLAVAPASSFRQSGFGHVGPVGSPDERASIAATWATNQDPMSLSLISRATVRQRPALRRSRCLRAGKVRNRSRSSPKWSGNAIDLGLDAALPAVLELESKIGEFGRGERARASLTQQSLRFVMINRTPRESFPATALSA